MKLLRTLAKNNVMIEWHYNMDNCRDCDYVLDDNEVEIQVPFIGTYEALDRLIDSDVERELEWRTDEKLPEVVSAQFDMHRYLTDYVGEIADICGLPSLKFRYLSSPAYYNFSTDKIICSVDKNELWELYHDRMGLGHYHKAVREATTPRDGYMPFYDEEDCRYDSPDDFKNSALLGLILDAYLNQWLWVEVRGYANSLICTWELFIHMCHGYESICEYMLYTEIEND